MDNKYNIPIWEKVNLTWKNMLHILALELINFVNYQMMNIVHLYYG